MDDYDKEAALLEIRQEEVMAIRSRFPTKIPVSIVYLKSDYLRQIESFKMWYIFPNLLDIHLSNIYFYYIFR